MLARFLALALALPPWATPGDCPAYAAAAAQRLDDLLAAEARH